MPAYRNLVEESAEAASELGCTHQRMADEFIDRLFVLFGSEILNVIPGRVSTEVPASLSFDTAGTVAKARKLISLYEKKGFSRDRILIKIASTWEGIRAAEVLESEGIHCNLTLLFSFAQAVACAQAGVTLISPFVGRIYDWYQKERGGTDIAPDQDPGVASVTHLQLLQEIRLQDASDGSKLPESQPDRPLGGMRFAHDQPGAPERTRKRRRHCEARTRSAESPTSEEPRLRLEEKSFRWMHNEDAMATEKLAEGIRKFNSDTHRLEQFARSRVAETIG